MSGKQHAYELRATHKRTGDRIDTLEATQESIAEMEDLTRSMPHVAVEWVVVSSGQSENS